MIISVRTLRFVFTVATMFSAGMAGAATVDVAPGAGTLQAAIDAAAPGDQLRLHDGVYGGAVVINKALKIDCYAVTDTCVIDAACGDVFAVNIVADKVSLATKKAPNEMRIQGGTSAELFVGSSQGVKLSGLRIGDEMTAPCGTEGNGFVIDASSVVAKDIISILFGARIQSIPAGAKVLVSNSAFRIAITGLAALEIDDSGDGAELGKGGIKLKRVSMSTFGDGNPPADDIVHLVNSDGIAMQKCDLTASHLGSVTGIDIDATSDHNLFKGNNWTDLTLLANSTPYMDAGTGNCAVGNNFPDSCP